MSLLYDGPMFTYYFICLEGARGEFREELKDIKECANNAIKDMTDVKKATEDTREETKKIKKLIESLTKNPGNTDKINGQVFTQIKELLELFTQLKSNMANSEVPSHGELCSICFCFILNL